MSLIEKDENVLQWKHLKRDDVLTKRGPLHCTEPHRPWTSVEGQTRLEVQSRYFKAMAKFDRLVDRNYKNHSVANSCSKSASSARFSYSCLPIASSLIPSYLSSSAALERAILGVPTNVPAAQWKVKRVRAATNETKVGFSPNTDRIVPHSKSSTTAATNIKPNRFTEAPSQCRSPKSFSELTGGVCKSVSPGNVNAPNVSTMCAKKRLLTGFPAAKHLSPVSWAHALCAPATPPVASKFPTLSPSLLSITQKPSDAKSLPKFNMNTPQFCGLHPRREQEKKTSSVFLPPDQEYHDLSLPIVKLYCAFRPGCLENPHASKIMFSERQEACSYMNLQASELQGAPNSTKRNANVGSTLKEIRNKALVKLPGVDGSEDKRDALVSERTLGENANTKACIQQPKPVLHGKALTGSSEKSGHVASKHQRRSGWPRRPAGRLRDKNRSCKRNDSVCLPIISKKTKLGNGMQFANTNNAALAFASHSLPRAANNSAAARSDVATSKSTSNNVKSSNKSTKETFKLPVGGPKSKETYVKTEEKRGKSPIKLKEGESFLDDCENDGTPKKSSMTQGMNSAAANGQSITKLPGLKLGKSVGKSRPKSKHRRQTVLSKPADAVGQSRQMRRPQGGVGQEEKPAAAKRAAKRFPCAKARQGAGGVGSTKRILPPDSKPSTCNSMASIITEEEEALLRAKWAELKFLSLPSPRKPKDESPRNKLNDLKGKKTNRKARDGGVKKKPGKKSRRKKEIQKKRSVNV